jgi:hypothetical protein
MSRKKENSSTSCTRKTKSIILHLHHIHAPYVGDTDPSRPQTTQAPAQRSIQRTPYNVPRKPEMHTKYQPHTTTLTPIHQKNENPCTDLFSPQNANNQLLDHIE